MIVSYTNDIEKYLEYEEIKESHLDELALLYVETFNAAPWNDEWTFETARKRLQWMIQAEVSFGLCVYWMVRCAVQFWAQQNSSMTD